MELQIGQRINVWEILSQNLYTNIGNNGMHIGSHHIQIRQNDFEGGVWIDTPFGHAYNYPLQGAVKMVGTLVVTKLPCHICGNKTEYICRDCEQPVCENCQAPYNQFSQIDYDCCADCYNSQRPE